MRLQPFTVRQMMHVRHAKRCYPRWSAFFTRNMSGEVQWPGRHSLA